MASFVLRVRGGLGRGGRSLLQKQPKRPSGGGSAAGAGARQPLSSSSGAAGAGGSKPQAPPSPPPQQPPKPQPQQGWTGKEKAGLLLFGSLVAGTTALGAWQSQRYFWKLEQIDERARSLAQAPVPLPTEEEQQLAGGAAPEPLRPYTVRGRFLHDKELRVGPRSAPKSIHGPAQGLGTGPQGHYILTPFKADNGRLVIVNRGWAPLKASNAPQGLQRPNGRVTLLGVVANGETPGGFAPPNDFGKRTLLWIDLPAVVQWVTGKEKEAGACYFLELAPPEGGASGGGDAWPKARALADVGEFYVQPVTHLVYAATWFSLAGFGAFASRRLLRRGR